jgi:dTDP-glucose 4,6-dehydratase
MIKSGEKIPVYGDGKNLREWIHVEDHCRGIQTVINFGFKGEIYNIGSGEELSNLEVAKLLLENAPSQDSDIIYVQDRKGHDFRYSVNSTKIKKIGFEVSQGLRESLPTLW